MRQTRALLLSAALLLFVGACGGGGGSGSTVGGSANGTFNGSYVLAQFSALRSFSTPAAEATGSAWGRVVADGAGMVVATVGENDNGTVSAPTLQPAAAYSVAADGTLTLPSSTGGMAADGAAGVFMTNVAGEEPDIGCVLRTSGAYSNMSLSGNYHFGQIVGAIGTRAAVWSTTAQGPLVADGMGGLGYPSHTINASGAVSTSTGGLATYAVTAEGTLTGDSLAGPFQGGLTPDGSFAIVAGGTSSGNAVTLLALIKYSAAATQALFSGSYWVVAISSDSGSNGDWSSFIGTLTADGAGNLDLLSATSNIEGVISTLSGADSYAVAANGTLSLSDSVGAISADGRYAFLCGSTTGPTSALTLLIRK